MSVDLYYIPMSPPCRSVMLVAEAVGLSLNLIPINPMKGENKTPEYLEMNPIGTIPFLVDGDVKIAESRAIICYLVDQYAKDDKFYPKSAKERALIDQRLTFDLMYIFRNIIAYYMPVLYGKSECYDEAVYKQLNDAMEILDKLLDGSEYCAGRQMTIADFSLIANVSTAEVLGFDFSPYKNVTRWMEKMKNSAPGYKQINDGGLDDLRRVVIEMKNTQDNAQQPDQQAPNDN